ncbi:type II toxin-antitoxin system death-on-curing family toxin [Shewanella oncorhynchi]|uniref:type II toxin-antitoxin system death-on-curing family toxin n=1 Tax=Shewanella oncorhynchi TaxID=2726434 RepID=UPI0039EF940D
MNIETIKFIHEYLTNYFEGSDDPISPPGIKDIGMLESAVARPFATAGGRDAFPDVFEKAAALFHGIIGNHSFYNGNKRSALLSTLYFLGDNNYIVDRCDDEEMFEFTRQVAAHEISAERSEELGVIKDWFSRNARKMIKGEQRLKFTELREILTRFGYDVIENGMQFQIELDGEFITKIIKKGMSGKEEYDQSYIAQLRKRLKLTAEYGIDSAIFYGTKGVAEELNEFMEMRSEVMRKLAKI